MTDNHIVNLRRWYLAQLRKTALDLDQGVNTTPSHLLTTDKKTIQKLVSVYESSLYENFDISTKGNTKKNRIKIVFSNIELLFLVIISLTLLSSYFFSLSIFEHNRINIFGLQISNLEFNLILIILFIFPWIIFYLVTFRKFFVRFHKLVNTSNLVVQKYTECLEPEKYLVSDNSNTETNCIDELNNNMKIVENVLRESYEKERLIADYSVQVLCMLDLNGKILAICPSCFRDWGWSSYDLIGKQLTELILAEFQNEFEQKLKKSSQNSCSVEFETIMLKADGTLVDTLWNIDWSESTQTYYCTSIDITSKKQLERLKEEFLAIISHDMRAPLTAINLTINLLEKGKYGELTEKGLEKIQSIEKNINRLLNLTNNILDIERSEKGLLAFELQDTILDEVFNCAVESISELAKHKNIKLDIEHNDLRINANKDCFIQIILNLLSNAIKFSPSNSTIKLKAQVVSNEVEITVSDEGLGIAKEYQTVIFERYKQVNLSDSRERQGSGLGLAICKAFTDAQGGKIGVKSELGKGSTFWIKMPYN